MHPILFYIGTVPIYTFGVCLACAFLLAWGLLPKRIGLPRYHEVLHGLCPDTTYAWMWLGAIVGAKGWYALYHLSDMNSLQALGTLLGASGGLVWYGGLLGAMLALMLVAYGHATRGGQPFIKTCFVLLDVFAPLASLGLVLGRVGCWFAGCCYGAVTQSVWAVYYPHTHPTHGVGVHPAPLYEAVGALCLTVLLLTVERWLSASGQHPSLERQTMAGRGATNAPHAGVLTALFLIFYGGLRCMTEALRGDTIQVGHTGLSVSQWVSVIGILIGFVGLCVKYGSIFQGYHQRTYSEKG
ncbi:MAG: prolipoprotein diacylglyceryl transferase [Vampirovibrionales bacterium]